MNQKTQCLLIIFSLTITILFVANQYVPSEKYVMPIPKYNFFGTESGKYFIKVFKSLLQMTYLNVC